MPTPIDIFNAYPKPRRVKRPNALRAIDRAISKVGAAELLAKTRTYTKSVQWRVDNGRYGSNGYDGWQSIPMAASWFNAEQFNDPIEDHDENTKGDGRVKATPGKYDDV